MKRGNERSRGKGANTTRQQKEGLSCVSVLERPLSGHSPLALALAVLGVVLGAFEHPEVRRHGLFAVRGVALGEERCLVGVDLHEIFRTEAYGAADGGEACTSCELIGQRRCRAFHM